MPELIDEWLPALEALNLAKRHMAGDSARIAICTRAHLGLIRTRAKRLVMENQPPLSDFKIPIHFWWAEGREALDQVWPTGDFATSIEGKPIKAFGVEFNKGDVLSMLGVQEASPAASKVDPQPAADSGPAPQHERIVSSGRPRAEFWEDMIIEVARQIHYGELKATKQADVQNAMADWLSAKGHRAADSSVRTRAQKLWEAFSKE